jgi:hypothetical protein
MKTNKAKYDILFDLLEQKCNDFIKSLFSKLPEKYHAIAINYVKYKEGYFIQEREIIDIGYRHGFYKKDKPTRKEIEKLQNYINNIELKADNIYIVWKAENTSSSERICEINMINSHYAWSKEFLMPTLKKLIDTYSPKEGYIKCSYCGKQRKPEDINYKTIISQNWKDIGFESPKRPYCNDNPCASHDQMAHEG